MALGEVSRNVKMFTVDFDVDYCSYVFIADTYLSNLDERLVPYISIYNTQLTYGGTSLEDYPSLYGSNYNDVIINYKTSLG